MYRLLIFALFLAAPLTSLAQDRGDEVAAVLDALHLAASEADFEGYFSLYADGAVFLGTDQSERWPLETFKAYTRDRFASGTAWTYHMLERNIDFSPDGQTAWFDEKLTNEFLGKTRGSGVLIQVDGNWRIKQYNLTILVPNDLARPFAALIREHEAH